MMYLLFYKHFDFFYHIICLKIIELILILLVNKKDDKIY